MILTLFLQVHLRSSSPSCDTLQTMQLSFDKFFNKIINKS